MNNKGQRLSSNLLCPRIDTSTPKSFYCSPKSYHYIPFAQRKFQSKNFKRQSGDKQLDPRLYTKQDISNDDSPVSSASFKAAFMNTNQTDRSVQSVNNQQKESKKVFDLFQSKVLSHTPSCVYDSADKEMREKVDQFKNETLDNIIQRGVYTDSVIQDCISRSVAENSTLAMAKLQQAISELLTDIGVCNVEVNKETWITSSKLADEEVLNYENKEFDSDESESLSMIPSSMESNSDKLARKEKSLVSNFELTSTTDSLTTLSNSSVTDTSN